MCIERYVSWTYAYDYIVTGEFEKGNTEVEVADLCIAMGSSLTVTPAADLPEVDHATYST